MHITAIIQNRISRKNERYRNTYVRIRTFLRHVYLNFWFLYIPDQNMVQKK